MAENSDNRSYGPDSDPSSSMSLFVYLNDTTTLKDVPLQAIGAINDTRNIACSLIDFPAYEICPVDQERFSEMNGVCMKLNACGHLIHEECLRYLINTALRSAPRCPTCPKELGCEARDFQGVLEGESESESESSEEDESLPYSLFSDRCVIPDEEEDCWD